ncbi:MAG: efflux RND transporter periplasmic adaptor subunit [Gammaproteobacteria bacterium]|nr:efflux RND transporter periplasmic adaptor subunit [Gammaproteobacteria bacterium]
MYNHRLFTLLLCVFLSACGTEAEHQSTEPATALTVTTSRIQQARLVQQVLAQGNVVAWQEAQVSSRIGAIPLVEVLVNVGDQVEKGQLLARLDERTVRVDMAQAEAGLAEAEAARIEADANYARVRQLSAAQNVSEQDLLLAKTRAATALARQQSAAALLQQQRLRLADCRILAPDDGVISARQAVLGQIPVPGSDLFRLIRQNRLEWRAELLPEQISRVQPGQQVLIDLPGGGQTEGRVRQLAPALGLGSRLGLAYIDLPIGSGARAGMFLSGQIRQQEYDALVVPAESIVLRDGRSMVFLVNEDGAVNARRVETGARQADRVEIVAGLQAGDVVAVAGAGFLADGDRVQFRTMAQVPAP